jgi:hypothetical protein
MVLMLMGIWGIGMFSFLKFKLKFVLTIFERFYYADQRESDGRPVAESRDGDAHAEMYFALAQEEKQSKWLVTFTKAKGREPFLGVDFEGNTRASYDERFGR